MIAQKNDKLNACFGETIESMLDVQPNKVVYYQVYIDRNDIVKITTNTDGNGQKLYSVTSLSQIKDP